MSEHIDIFEDVKLPLIPLRGMVGFPGVQLSIEIVRTISLKAFTASATTHDAHVLLVSQKDIAVDDPKPQDLSRIGVVAEIKHVVKNPQGNLSVVFEGKYRAKIEEISLDDAGFIIATAIAKKERESFKPSTTCEAMMAEIKAILSDIKNIHPTFDEELRIAAEAITAPGYFADFVASSALIDYKNKQSVLDRKSVV